MTSLVVIGTQWGDEGKGKIVDLLTEDAHVVARFQGGNNAGHTIKFQDQSFVLHLIPSGVFRGALSVIGNGVVIDPQSLLTEIEDLKKLNVSVEKLLKISLSAHLVMPYHKIFDKLKEQRKGDAKIGTTGRGIGPAYAEKVSRSGIRLLDLLNPALFRSKLEEILQEKNCLLKHFYDHPEQLSLERIVAEYGGYFEQIRPYLTDTVKLLNEAIEEGKNVLFEGAQGTFLDIDHGTYPYVTSSNTVAGGVCTGCGIGPNRVNQVLGITKAYTTRVGSGPFPTEQLNETGEFLRKEGSEYGATTGRPRRCGWFDAVLVKQAVRLNGVTSLAMTKLDILDKLDKLQIAVAYRDQAGNVYQDFPTCDLQEVTPIYEEFEGWKSSTYGMTHLEQLPNRLRKYLDRISELTRAPVSIISTGPKREETILLNQAGLWLK